MPTFTSQDYTQRRKRLREKVQSGLILLLGNQEASMNYPANQYGFRQDSSFLYFFGLDKPDLVGLIDIEEGRDSIYGTDFTLEDVIWMGPQPALRELAREVGVTDTGTPDQLAEKLGDAKVKGRAIHFLPPYRAEHWLQLETLLGKPGAELKSLASGPLIHATIDLRSIKSEAEVGEIEKAVEVTHEVYAAIVKAARPGASESVITGIIEGIVASHDRRLAYPIICTVHGERLHNHHHGNRLEKGNLLLVDAGSESPGHYASDITRTYPIGGVFTPEQRDIYQIVHKAQAEAIASIVAGKPYREVHLHAAAVVASGLKDMGLITGSVDAVVEQGAHALFFPHGLGHMLGLDVHDMEGLGEDRVGYEGARGRSSQFGLAYLRLAKALEPGNVLTVEPGIYFIPALIDEWKSKDRFKDLIDYGKVERFREFGGIRIEDDVLVTDGKARVLGKPIPKTVDEIESLMSA